MFSSCPIIVINVEAYMKDRSHHLNHIQKKVIQETRKQAPLERVVLSSVMQEPQVMASPKKRTRHIPAPPRIKSPAFH